MHGLKVSPYRLIFSYEAKKSTQWKNWTMP